MTHDDALEELRRLGRRRFVQCLGAGAAAASVAGCIGRGQPGASLDETHTTETTGTATGTPDEESDAPEPGERITSARRIGVRDVSDYDYRALWSYRKRESLEALLSDPRVNELAKGWVAGFEAYDPLTNFLDSVSIQGTTGMEVEGSVESGTFDVVATDRQVAYGLVDRRTDELVALEVTDPRDITWTREFGDEMGRKRHEFVLGHDEVWKHLEGRVWYPLVKVAEVITAYADYPHGEVTPVAYFFMDEGELSVLSVFLDVSDPENLQLLDVTVVENFVEHPPAKLASTVATHDETVLGTVPGIPLEKRPQITGPEGFHNIEQIPDTIDQAGWHVTWEPPTTQGAMVTASYNGQPVFETVAPYVTYTGYDLPRREGRNTAEWLFPNADTVFSGELLYWDIHSQTFGGPGMLAKTDYPTTERHPEGFRIRTHFHTGALPSAMDFHSGHRFAPYNYHMHYDFYGDGVFIPVWQRQGPGYVTEFMFARERVNDGPVQFYVSGWAMDVTPGTTEGVETQVFDGDEWYTPETEFYLQGDEESMVRFANPDGCQKVDIPLDETKEIVVVRQHPDEIGEATRVEDIDAELAFYHPAQYVDDEPIQGERVFAWLLLEAPTYELPHSAGITTYTTFGEVNLEGY